jgi:hypothetical protein
VRRGPISCEVFVVPWRCGLAFGLLEDADEVARMPECPLPGAEAKRRPSFDEEGT